MKDELKVVVIGDGYVGKTCLLRAIRDSSFEEQAPNLHDSFSLTLEDPSTKEDVPVLFVDTAGQEEFDHLRKHAYEDVNVFLLCFCMSDMTSFDNIEQRWKPDIKLYLNNKSMNIILVGTKCDEESKISREKIEKTRKNVGAAFFVKCSAKSLEGINDLKKYILRCKNEKKSCTIQ